MSKVTLWGSLWTVEDNVCLVEFETNNEYSVGRNSKVCHPSLIIANPRISTTHCTFYNHNGVPTLKDKRFERSKSNKFNF